jgi:asparagine synthase (glutamine-hydrolysing)
MCGVSGLLDRAGSAAAPEALRAMHATIRHRGPDGEGLLLLDRDGRVSVAAPGPDHSSRTLAGLAFRWLKILDPSDAARQPMLSPDKRHALVFNGEIYNFRDLRHTLEARGRVFRTRGDAEVVLAAYEVWGADCFARLDGMWAIVLLDLARRRLVLSRDRFGIKPLHFARRGSRLFLGSEIKQVLAGLGERPRPHPRTLARFLRGSLFPCIDDTFFEEVRAVPPATWCEVPLDGGPIEPLEFRPYWSLSDFNCPAPESPSLSYADALARLHATLAATIETHRVADVTVGSLLSGGLDSSLLTSLGAAAARAAGQPWPTFSVGLGNGGRLDELRFAHVLVERDGLENHAAILEPAWFASNATAVIRALEEPPLGMAALAQYRAFELARAGGATVVLDGQGADEVFGGYAGHQRMLVGQRFREGRVVAALRELGAMATWQERGFLSFAAEYAWKGLARRAGRDFIYLDPGFCVSAAPAEREAAGDFGRDPSAVNRALYHAVRRGNVRVVLPYSDKSAMAHSVEARVPYFDRAVVELAFSLPDSYKVGGGEVKRLLRDVGRLHLPPAITERKDRGGFTFDEQAWLRRELWPVVRETTGSGILRSAPFRTSVAERYLDDFGAARHDDFRAVWRLYALAVWADAFSVQMP